jgi:glycosyltransferase involved in cell wall biosynthesis
VSDAPNSVHRSPVYLSVVLPAKDEQERLPEMLNQVDALIRRIGRPCELVVTDDGSRDDTAEILRRWGAEHDYLRVVTHETNHGKGEALKSAAAASVGEYLLTVDADATYSLSRVESFLEALENGAGAAIGNRRDKRTRYVLHPTDFLYLYRRHLMGYVFARIAKTIAGLDMKDTQCGFKAYRGDVARELFPQVEARQFAFDVEILALLQHYGHEIAQLPVTYVFKDQPTSVRASRDGMRMIRRLFRVRRKIRDLRRNGK